MRTPSDGASGAKTAIEEESMDSVVTFLLTQNPDAAIAFFRDTLGLKFLHDDGFALVFDLNGVMLRISKVPSFSPAQHTVLGWESGDIESTVDELMKKGVAFTHYPNMGQDERGDRSRSYKSNSEYQPHRSRGGKGAQSSKEVQRSKHQSTEGNHKLLPRQYVFKSPNEITPENKLFRSCRQN